MDDSCFECCTPPENIAFVSLADNGHPSNNAIPLAVDSFLKISCLDMNPKLDYIIIKCLNPDWCHDHVDIPHHKQTG